MSLSIIVAMTKNGVIGKDGQLPWLLPRDLRYFSEKTRGYSVLMGRKTYEAILKKNGKPLPFRENIVLTRNQNFVVKEGCSIFNDWKEILDLSSKQKEEIFVIGGAEIYALALAYVDKLYITEIDAQIKGDTFFPQYQKSDWVLEQKSFFLKDKHNAFDMWFKVYKRKRKQRE